MKKPLKESQIQALFCKWLDALHIYYTKIIVATEAGTPDVIACINGRFVAFEFKTNAGIMSELQKYKQAKILRSGGIYQIVDEDYLKQFIQD